jgi:dethiobiotin synthase
MKTFFITGIDTDAGKSVATGMLARYLLSKGVNVITQKLIQTGCIGVSEDIITHRKIMKMELQPVDNDFTTCPQVFTYPCSPHLAAEIDNRTIDFDAIKASTAKLEKLYDKVLLEGAGGLMVPITRSYYTIDYIADNQLPVILVTSSKLGSINHTLLSLEALFARDITVAGIIYNKFPAGSEQITADSILVIRDYLKQKGKQVPLAEMGKADDDSLFDFASLQLED